MARSTSNNPYREQRNPARDMAARLHDCFISAERDGLLGAENLSKARDWFAKLSEQPVEKQKKKEKEE